MDTHGFSNRTDLEIHLPGEVDAGAEDSNSDVWDENDDDRASKGELSNVFTGMNRKATINTRRGLPSKVAKTMVRASSSTAVLNMIDGHRPNIAPIDVAVGESVLSHLYGRDGCLYMEVKVDTNKKPNRQKVVSSKVESILRKITEITHLPHHALRDPVSSTVPAEWPRRTTISEKRTI